MIAKMRERIRRHPWLTALTLVAVGSVAGIAVLAVLFVLGLQRYSDFDGRFARSRSALDGYAARAMSTPSGEPLPELPSSLGEFRPGHAERLQAGFLFFCDYGHPLDANGLAYLTQPPPTTMPSAGKGTDYFKHIEGNWYTVLRN